MINLFIKPILILLLALSLNVNFSQAITEGGMAMMMGEPKNSAIVGESYETKMTIIPSVKGEQLTRMTIANLTPGGSVPQLVFDANNQGKNNVILKWVPNEIDFELTEELEIRIDLLISKEENIIMAPVRVEKKQTILHTPIPLEPDSIADSRGRYLIKINKINDSLPIKPGMLNLTEYYSSDCSWTYSIEVPNESNVDIEIIDAPASMGPIFPESQRANNCGRDNYIPDLIAAGSPDPKTYPISLNTIPDIETEPVTKKDNIIVPATTTIPIKQVLITEATNTLPVTPTSNIGTDTGAKKIIEKEVDKEDIRESEVSKPIIATSSMPEDGTQNIFIRFWNFITSWF